MTLKEGLKQFHQKNSRYFGDDKSSKESIAFFESHDIAHVVFGCDTTFYGEGIVKIWTIFGTTLGFWNHVKGYSDGGAFGLFKMYSWQHVAKNFAKLLISIPKVIIRANRMNKKWLWSGHESYLNMKIEDLRKEFKIEVI